MTDFDKWYALSELNTSSHTPKEIMDEAFQAGAGLCKPKWQSLSDEEINLIYPCTGGEHDFKDIARAIEKALREKNG